MRQGRGILSDVRGAALSGPANGLVGIARFRQVPREHESITISRAATISPVAPIRERRRVTMALVPDTKAGKVAFYKSRLALWTENSVAIGSSAAEITALSALVTAAEAAVLDQDEKHETARSYVP